jgi:hypothetical protein
MRNNRVVLSFAFGFLVTSCGAPNPEPNASVYSVEVPSPKSASQADLDAWTQKAAQLGTVTLTRPSDQDPKAHIKAIAYFRESTLPESMNGVPNAPRALTENEGRRLYFTGYLPLVETANKPSPSTSEFEKAIQAGLVVEPPCATTTSQVLKAAATKAGFSWMASMFQNPHDYYPTHNDEIQLARLGFSYYLKSKYVAPPASVGAWDRYTFFGVKDHTGHIFTIFKDGGPNGPDLVGDNTRRSNEPHGHPYREPGNVDGFWLPPGVYPHKR